jgi:hypothetical protein
MKEQIDFQENFNNCELINCVHHTFSSNSLVEKFKNFRSIINESDILDNQE